MAISRVGNNLATKNHLPVSYSPALIARYYAEDMIPKITTNKYDAGLLAKNHGEKLVIRREPVFVTEDVDINAPINWQTVDFDSISVELSYFKRTAGKVDNLDMKTSDLDLGAAIPRAMQKAHSEIVGATLLGSVYTGATTTAYSTGTTPWAWQTGTNSASALAQAFAALSALKVPDDGNLAAVIHPYMAQYLTQIQPGWALNSGLATGAQIAGHIGHYAGFNIFVSPLVPGAGTAANPFKAIALHKDAIAMAAIIKDAWAGSMLPVADGFGWKQNSVFGFTVAQPDGLVYMPTTVS